jgi:hypothetical protein
MERQDELYYKIASKSKVSALNFYTWVTPPL